VKSSGQIKHEATIEERKRLNLVVATQIDILQDRINQSQNDFIKQAWTIALIELMEIQRLTNQPMKAAS
jgi:hypothetical protein